MANVIIDSSVAIKWFFTEPHSDSAVRLLDQFHRGDATFLVPDLFFAEIGNILWKKQRFQGFDAADVRRILDEILALSFIAVPSATLLPDAYDLAVRYQRTVYDSLYLALGLRERCSFVTADERLVNSVASGVPNILWLPDWP